MPGLDEEIAFRGIMLGKEFPSKNQMDTDYLSRECYKAIIIEAEKLSHDLTLHYGLLSIDCKNEDEYIDKAEQMTREIMQADDAELEDLFWGNLPDKKKFQLTCTNILENIGRVRAIPFDKRKFDF